MGSRAGGYGSPLGLTRGVPTLPTLGDVQRLYDFLRSHPTGVDAFWAVLLFGCGLLWLVQATAGLRSHRSRPCRSTLALCAVVALRRRAPEMMLVLAIACGVAQLALDVKINLVDFAMLVIVYTVAAPPRAGPRGCALGAAIGAPSLATLRWPSAHEPRATRPSRRSSSTIPFVLAWVLGDSIRTRRAYYAQLEERAARLEKEREAQSKVAVAAERARIARELHDVVAHNVSVMVVQADGAAYVLDASPDQARQALETQPDYSQWRT